MYINISVNMHLNKYTYTYTHITLYYNVDKNLKNLLLSLQSNITEVHIRSPNLYLYKLILFRSCI